MQTITIPNSVCGLDVNVPTLLSIARIEQKPITLLVYKKFYPFFNPLQNCKHNHQQSLDSRRIHDTDLVKMLLNHLMYSNRHKIMDKSYVPLSVAEAQKDKHIEARIVTVN